MYLVQYADNTSMDELRVDVCFSQLDLIQMWQYDACYITIRDVKEVSAVFKLVVAGSRGFTNYELLRDRLDYLLQNQIKEQIVIISGKAAGADTLGEQYAKERGLMLEEMPADWQPVHLGGKTDRGAGHKRNADMARACNAAVLFWDGKSPGTKGMYDICKRLGKDVRVESV